MGVGTGRLVRRAWAGDKCGFSEMDCTRSGLARCGTRWFKNCRLCKQPLITPTRSSRPRTRSETKVSTVFDQLVHVAHVLVAPLAAIGESLEKLTA